MAVTLKLNQQNQALQEYKNEVRGKQRLGVQAFAEAMLIIPKCLAQNGGHDAQECLVKMLQEHKGLDKCVSGLITFCKLLV